MHIRVTSKWASLFFRTKLLNIMMNIMKGLGFGLGNIPSINMILY